MAALRAAVFPLSAKNRRGGHFLPPPVRVRCARWDGPFYFRSLVWGSFWPLCFRQLLGNEEEQRKQIWQHFSMIKLTSVVKQFCYGHIRSYHQVGSRDIIPKKVWARARVTVPKETFWNCQNVIRPIVPKNRIFRFLYKWPEVMSSL